MARYTPEKIEELRDANRRANARAYQKRKLGLLPPQKRMPREKKLSSLRMRSTSLHYDAKIRAKKKGIDFEIEKDWVLEKLRVGICERSGFHFDLTPADGKRTQAFSPSLDRIDNSKGYTVENTQVVCYMYNAGKGEQCNEDFIRMCHGVALNNPLPPV